MVKKIIEVLDGIETIFVAEEVPAHSGPFMTNKRERQLKVSDLPDAPENRVIELPDDVINDLKMFKEDNGDDNLQGFMNDVNDDGELWQDVERFNHSVMPTDALLGEWWLGHIEFAPKKYPKFKVLVELHEGDLWVTKNRTHDIDDEEISFS